MHSRKIHQITKKNCALNLADEIILYYDARSIKTLNYKENCVLMLADEIILYYDARPKKTSNYKENCALKLVDKIILYYDARSKKKHQTIYFVCQSSKIK